MRKMPIGAEIIQDAVHFRIWAPKCKSIEVLIDGRGRSSLKSEKNGYFSGAFEEIREDDLYKFVVDGGDAFPDPASRCQPQGPHGPSQIINPNKFNWTDHEWKGITEKDQVILYEFHVGTFTEEGTWQAAAEKLPYLRGLGVTLLEMMPIAEFPGKFNWGYDGVDLFAPTRNYGTPDDLRSFINEAHHLGLGVILDVVYNHFGPSGNYLYQYSDFYLTEEEGDWGKTINFDGEHCKPVREFFIENAGYWIDEYHFDGLRLDACHAIHDRSSPHIFLEICKKVKEKGGGRSTYVSAENEKQESIFVFSEDQGGYQLDAVWNEDFHHSAYVRLTGRKEAYFSDYCGRSQEFLSSAKFNFLYQGQWYPWQQQCRGTPAIGVPAYHFINFLENHDQVANTGNAQRLHSLSQPKAYRAMTTLWLLSPQIPLFFQGQEFASSPHFHYFCDHEQELAGCVDKGRLEFLSQFVSMHDPNVIDRIPLPHEERAFRLSKLKWQEKENHGEILQFHKDLIQLRKRDPVFHHLKEAKIEGSVLTDDVFLLRYFSPYGERLLLVNFGVDYLIEPASDPLLAPSLDRVWTIRWSSEFPEYGGSGFRQVTPKGSWTITGCSACLLYLEKKAPNL